jgi:ABC-2 type transport system permease protein
VSDTVAGLSFLTRFDSISKGVVALRDLIYFLSLIGVALAINGIVIDAKKAG